MHSKTHKSAHPLISIIIPTLNEEYNIVQTLLTTAERCLCPNACEIIVVDGGSHDATLPAAQGCAPRLEEYGITPHLLTSPRGRARQMNLGAEHASGDILLFLHADTLLPIHFDKLIIPTLTPGPLVLGAFHLKSDTDTHKMRWICWWANIRARVLSLPYGDQALFIRRSDFIHLGMFPELEIMEDFALVRRVKRLSGKIHLLKDGVVTSARRWEKRGCLITTLCNQSIILGYYLKIPTRYLAQWYRR